jgi:hypothetical protein
MLEVHDDKHCTVTAKVVQVIKRGTLALDVTMSCHSSPETLTFDDEGARDEYFKLLVEMINKEP